MKLLKLSLAAAAAALALGGVAQAEDRPLGLALNAGVASDYVFRGISQTDNNPQVFGGADISFAGIGYAGVWGSNVDFNNGTDAEYDVYVGFKPTLGSATFDFAAIRYGYINSPSRSNQDYWEFKGAVSAPAGPVTLGAAVFYSPEFFGKTGDAVYYEGNIAAAIPETKFSVSGALGYQDVSYAGDYTTWNAGVAYAITDHVSLDVRYWDTDAHSFGKIYDHRAVATLKAVF